MADDFRTLDALWAIRDDRELSAVQKAVEYTFVSYADANGRCHPSQATIARASGTSTSSVKRTIAAAQTKGPLNIEASYRKSSAGDLDSCVYTLSLRQGSVQCEPTSVHPEPTSVQSDPTVGSPGTDGSVHPEPTGPSTVSYKEDSSKRTSEEDKEEGAGEVFQYWADHLYAKVAKTSRPPKRTPGRLKHIRARLADGYTVIELQRVIDRVAVDDHMLGRTEENATPYVEPENFMRSVEKVDKWLNAGPPQKRNGARGPVQHGDCGPSWAEAGRTA